MGACQTSASQTNSRCNGDVFDLSNNQTLNYFLLLVSVTIYIGNGASVLGFFGRLS